MQSKVCKTCGKRKSIKNFYTCTYGDGYRCSCKECTCESKKEARYKKLAGKLDVVKEIKAPKIDPMYLEAMNTCFDNLITDLDIVDANIIKVKLQRNISIIVNMLLAGAGVYFILK